MNVGDSVHPIQVEDASQVSKEGITHVPSREIQYFGRMRYVECPCGHFCPVPTVSERQPNKVYRCLCGKVLCIDNDGASASTLA